MQRKVRIPILVLAALVITASFSQALAASLALQPNSKLWLEGKSTIHEYKSTASSLDAKFGQDDTLWPAGVKGGEAVERFVHAKGVTSIEVVVPVTSLRSGKAGLDKNMYKALLAPKHPEIRFRLASYEITEGKTPGEMAIDAKGRLSIAGVERDIRMPVTAVRQGEGLRMRGSAPLLMTQFGIKPPAMMMGTLKTSDEVVVYFDLLIGVQAAKTMSSAE